MYILSAARVLLCMMPQNQWLTNKTPLAWGILRNIPFALLGLLGIVLWIFGVRKLRKTEEYKAYKSFLKDQKAAKKA